MRQVCFPLQEATRTQRLGNANGRKQLVPHVRESLQLA